MTALAQNHWQEQEDDPIVSIDGCIDADAHDAYWQSVYWSQPHFRGELDYEDYAPAYCVGYCGFAQYGGDYDDAEKSLCANWLRIKGSSRLELDVAMAAIRAAWLHAERTQAEPETEDEELVQLAPVRATNPQRQPAFAAA